MLRTRLVGFLGTLIIAATASAAGSAARNAERAAINKALHPIVHREFSAMVSNASVYPDWTRAWQYKSRVVGTSRAGKTLKVVYFNGANGQSSAFETNGVALVLVKQVQGATQVKVLSSKINGTVAGKRIPNALKDLGQAIARARATHHLGAR